MQRRDFVRLVSSAGALGITGLSPFSSFAASKKPAGQHHFELTTRVDLPASSGPARLWVPIPSAHSPHQVLSDSRWEVSAGGQAVIASLPDEQLHMLQVSWADTQAPRTVKLVNQFSTSDRSTSFKSGPPHFIPETAATLQHYLRPTRLLPVDGIVRKTADRITQGRSGAVDKAEAIYQWVVANACRLGSVPGCGTGDVAYMLTTGDLNGKCADINALFVALARAAGVPARDAYGLRVAPSAMGYKSMSASGDVTRAQHCRAEFYADGYGWVPADPADVRKVMLEEVPGGLPLDHPRVQQAKAYLFGASEGNWVAYNHGHDINLPGSTGVQLPFLMYPQAEIGQRLNSLDPATFRYSITAKQLDA